jgi:dipeptidyl-peptidase 4
MSHSRFQSALVIALTFATGVGAWAQPARTNAPARVFRDKIEPNWFAGADGETDKFWYRVDTGKESREFVLVNAAEGKRAPAFDHAKVAETLGKLTGGKVDPARLPVTSLEFARDGKTVMLNGTAGTNWNLDLQSYALTPSKDEASEERRLPSTRQPHPSRDGGAETEITLVNRLDYDADVFWVDSDGRRLPYGSLKPGESRQQHTFAGHVWLVAGRGGNVLAVFDAEERSGLAVIDGRENVGPGGRGARGRRGAGVRPAGPGQQSPDGKWEAVVRGHNLYLRDVATNKEQPLTFDAHPDSTYSRSEEADRAIEMNYKARDPETPTPEVYWSPDSRWLVAMRLQPGTQRRVYMVQSSPPDQLQPKLDSVPYLKPGDAVPVRKPHLFDIEAKREIPVSDTLFANPWSISDLRWDTNSARFTFLFNQRGHQALCVIAVDIPSGQSAINQSAATVKTLVDEQSKTFICYSAKFFSEYPEDTSEIIWMSERDGWNHLYLYDAKTGAVKNQITKGEWVVRSVDRVDKEKRQIWFQAGGIRPGQDPYYLHFCRVNFDGTGLTILTEGDGTHAAQFSPDRRFFLDTWSRVNLAPISELRRSDTGKLVHKLEEADASALFASGWIAPEPFVARGRDGVTDIYGVIHRPKDFDPKKKYPVVECIYAGPQDSFVPKRWQASYRWETLMARGFILVQIDGMGTANRSKKFHDVCFKNLADAGFPDRIAWMKAAAAKYPSLDITRVGLYGGSAGGQNALGGLLLHPEFYKAGAADCGCHDNRMDKVWWNEQWMGWPPGPEYEECSNVTLANRLQGKLLLTVGEMDKNVDPASTMQVVNALIKADKDFELIVFPNGGHGSGSSPYGERRRNDFFVRSLMGGAAGGPANNGSAP